MKVLSIDFDIIMKPCINLYNDEIDSTTDCKSFWQKKLIELKDKLDFDVNIFVDLLLLLRKQNVPINFIVGHNEIVNFIPEGVDIDLTNIDFHHDIYYKHHADKVNYTCANWVEHLILKGFLKSYTWYGTEISKQFNDELNIPFIKKDVSEIKELNEPFDLVVVCLSPHWVPPIFYPVWEKLVRDFKVS